jgi:hypothetical protein
MSAKAMSEASAKGGSMCASSNDKLGIKWDQQYAEFEGRKLHNWKLTDEQWTLGLDANRSGDCIEQMGYCME